MSIFWVCTSFCITLFSGFVMGAGLIEFGFGVEQSATSTWMCDCIESETRYVIYPCFRMVSLFCVMKSGL